MSQTLVNSVHLYSAGCTIQMMARAKDICIIGSHVQKTLIASIKTNFTTLRFEFRFRLKTCQIALLGLSLIRINMYLF